MYRVFDHFVTVEEDSNSEAEDVNLKKQTNQEGKFLFVTFELRIKNIE